MAGTVMLRSRPAAAMQATDHKKGSVTGGYTMKLRHLLAAAASTIALSASPLFAACPDGGETHQVRPRHQRRQPPQGHRRPALRRPGERRDEGQGLCRGLPELDPLRRRQGARGDARGRRPVGRALALEVRDLHQEAAPLRPALRLRRHRRGRPLPEFRGRPGAARVDEAQGPARPRPTGIPA